FFFQAEDGIRDRNVTGVQTCALPILSCTEAPTTTRPNSPPSRRLVRPSTWTMLSWLKFGVPEDSRTLGCPARPVYQAKSLLPPRSEERRVGKEWRLRQPPTHCSTTRC